MRHVVDARPWLRRIPRTWKPKLLFQHDVLASRLQHQRRLVEQLNLDVGGGAPNRTARDVGRPARVGPLVVGRQIGVAGLDPNAVARDPQLLGRELREHGRGSGSGVRRSDTEDEGPVLVKRDLGVAVGLGSTASRCLCGCRDPHRSPSASRPVGAHATSAVWHPSRFARGGLRGPARPPPSAFPSRPQVQRDRRFARRYGSGFSIWVEVEQDSELVQLRLNREGGLR